MILLLASSYLFVWLALFFPMEFLVIVVLRLLELDEYQSAEGSIRENRGKHF